MKKAHWSEALTRLGAFIAGMGSVIDLGATSRCPHCGHVSRTSVRFEEPDEAIVVDDWNVLADDFVRAARGERLPHRS